MESSFFEYRDNTGVDSDSEIIDDSFVDSQSFSFKKKKNRTAYIPETEESSTDDEIQHDRDDKCKSSNAILRRNIADTHTVLSSDDDGSLRGSFKRHSKIAHKKLIVQSSDDEDQQVSPELVPRRPPLTPKLTNIIQTTSNINKKRFLFDSDLDNSLITEHNRTRKLVCRKETPYKIDKGKSLHSKIDESIVTDEANMSMNKTDVEEDATTDDSDGNENDDIIDEKSFSRRNSNNKVVTSDETVLNDKELLNDIQNDKTVEINDKLVNRNKIIESDESSDDEPLSFIIKKGRNILIDSDDEPGFKSIQKKNSHTVISSDDDYDDDGPDEDQMAMSRATRMSIMGVIPKINDSDDSDFIESDDSKRKSSVDGSTDSLSELPAIGTLFNKTPMRKTEAVLESSRLSCSPFARPLHDISNEVMDLTNIPDTFNGKRVDNENLRKFGRNENFIKYDDDVTIIDIKPEIIDLSSDDEDEAKGAEKSKVKKSLRSEKNEASPKKSQDGDSIKSYLLPESYPNQGVIYVNEEDREIEVEKLNGLRVDIRELKDLVNSIDAKTLPDKGVMFKVRLDALKDKLRRQESKLANMVSIESENQSADDMNRDGFDKGLSWEDIKKASNAVQPRMFGKQALATHMAERNLILDRLRDLHESLKSRPPETELAGQPRGVTTKLMAYQQHALAWLRWRETQRPTAGILADDMGLGKTITMIALVVTDKENRIDEDDSDDDIPSKSSKLLRGGTLVVCPASLMQQWAGEVVKHCTSHCLSVCQHHGPSRSTQPHRLASHDLVLTTYNILQRDKEKNGVLMRVRWRRVILDEAHVVRNHKSATSGAVSALHAERRWCLTGTPVQNKDLDLFALLKFLRCSPFDELIMWKKWIDNKSLGGQERLSTIMRCILLRRTKQQLQQRGQLDCLPERSSHQKQVVLTKAELNVYQKVLVFSKTLFAQFLHQRAEKYSDTSLNPPSGKDSEYAKMHKKMIALQGAKPVKSHEILVLLLRLRQVCCHCGLIAAMLNDEGAGDVDEDPGGKDLLAELNKLSLEEADSRKKDKTNDDDEEEYDTAERTTVTEAIRSVLSPNNPVFSLEKPSSKIKAVMACLKENVFSKKGEKAVVVSQWTSVLRLVERELTQLNVRSVTLSGVVPVPSRPALIEHINNPSSDVRVLLLSLCAGGVGLNLCGANHLLLLDPHWNPQLEEQAQDRIYRVGQKKPVHIYRFMCVDTVEQTIKKLQEAKLELAANVLTGARNTNASKLTIEDLKMLFNMGQQQ